MQYTVAWRFTMDRIPYDLVMLRAPGALLEHLCRYEGRRHWLLPMVEHNCQRGSYYWGKSLLNQWIRLDGDRQNVRWRNCFGTDRIHWFTQLVSLQWMDGNKGRWEQNTEGKEKEKNHRRRPFSSIVYYVKGNLPNHLAGWTFFDPCVPYVPFFRG